LDVASKQTKGKTATKEIEEYREQLAEESLYKPKLFAYPDLKHPSTIFDFEDIENEEQFLVLCVRAKPGDQSRTEDTCYVWHGTEHEVSRDEQFDFVQKCIALYFGNAAGDRVKILQEHQADESSEF
jgi:hypothetical protein